MQNLLELVQPYQQVWVTVVEMVDMQTLRICVEGYSVYKTGNVPEKARRLGGLY